MEEIMEALFGFLFRTLFICVTVFGGLALIFYFIGTHFTLSVIVVAGTCAIGFLARINIRYGWRTYFLPKPGEYFWEIRHGEWPPFKQLKYEEFSAFYDEQKRYAEFKNLCAENNISLSDGLRLVEQYTPPTETIIYYNAHSLRAALWKRDEPERLKRESAAKAQLIKEVAERRAKFYEQNGINKERAERDLSAFVDERIAGQLPKSGSGDISIGNVPLISLIPNARRALADLVYSITTTKRDTLDVTDAGNDTRETTYVEQEAPTVFQNLGVAAQKLKMKVDYLKPAETDLPPLELASLCFKGTHYLDYLIQPVPLFIPSNKRVEHTHVLGRTGAGKSTTLFHMIHEDIRRADAAVIVIEPKGDLVRRVAHISDFVGNDRLAVIDPKYGPAFNFFALPQRLQSHSTAGKRQIIANIITQYSQALSALDAETSINQKTTLAYVVELVFNMGGTLWDFLRILEDRAKDYDKSEILPPLMKYVQEGDRGFFEEQFFSGMAPASRRSLAMKIRFLMKSAPQFETIFGANDNKIDLYERMQEKGSVTLINTSEGTLTSEASSFFGRLMLSQIMTAALERQALGEITHPVYVVVDEAHLYIDQTVEKFLLQTRSAKVGITLAHQQLKDLHAARDTVLTQPAIKIAAPSPEDADAMARNMRGTDADIFDNLNTGQFAVYFRPMPTALKISIPDTIRTAEVMDAEDYKILVDRNYHRFKDSPRTQPAIDPDPRLSPEPPATPTTVPSPTTKNEKSKFTSVKVDLGDAD